MDNGGDGMYLCIYVSYVYTQGLICNSLYKGTLAAFDNGVKPIVIHRCIVSLNYDTETGKF